MIEAPPEHKQYANMAGIVSLSGQPLDFGFEWPDSMMPLSKDYTAVERAVAECVYAGCETVWIVCNKDIQPLVKYRIGDYAEDPAYVSRKFAVNPRDHKKEVPIFYVSVHPNDRFRRDSLGWGVLYGALSAYYTTKQISKWVVPEKFYAAFPYGVYDPSILRDYKADITKEKTFFLSFNGQTIRDGLYLGFTFNAEDFKRFRKHVRAAGTGVYVPGQKGKDLIDGKYPTKKLPIEERWSARHFKLDKVFETAIIEKAKVNELPWYHGIDSWESYSDFIASGNKLERPSHILTKKRMNRLWFTGEVK